VSGLINAARTAGSTPFRLLPICLMGT